MRAGLPSYSEYMLYAKDAIAHPELFPDEVLKALAERKDPKLSECRIKGWMIHGRFEPVGIHPDAPQEAKDEWMEEWKNQSGYYGVIRDY